MYNPGNYSDTIDSSPIRPEEAALSEMVGKKAVRVPPLRDQKMIIM